MRRLQRLVEFRPVAATVLVVLLLACGVAAAQETTPMSALEVKYRRQIFENDRLAAYLSEIPPHHATLMHRHDTDMLTVFVAESKTRSTLFGRPPKEESFAVGEVRFRSAGFTHATENVGASTFRSVILEFKSPMGSMQPAQASNSHDCNPDTTPACVAEKDLLCSPQLCALDVRLAPGAIWGNRGFEKDQMLIAVSDFELSDKPERTAGKNLKRKSGEVEYLAGGSSRQWQNVTNEAAHIVVVEFR